MGLGGEKREKEEEGKKGTYFKKIGRFRGKKEDAAGYEEKGNKGNE